MCPTRHLCGPIEEAIFTEDSECAEFNRYVEDKPMTNGDRIRSMSNEELAKLIVKHKPVYSWCKDVREIWMQRNVTKIQAWVMWLQETYEGE